MKFRIDENGIHYYDLLAGDSVAVAASGDDDQGGVIPDAEAVAKVKQVAAEVQAGLEYCECRQQGSPTLCGSCK